MKVSNQDHCLNKIIDELKEKYNCHTIILYGSRARDDHNDASDYDIIAIRKKGSMERDCRMFEGAFLDAFIYSDTELNISEGSLLHLKDGIVLCQENDIGDKLIANVKEIIKKGPKPIPDWEKQVIVTWHDKMFKRASKGDIEGNFRRLWQLYDLLESYFKLRDKWYFGPKEGFAWLKNYDQDTYHLFESALNVPTDLNIIRKLINRVTLLH